MGKLTAFEVILDAPDEVPFRAGNTVKGHVKIVLSASQKIQGMMACLGHIEEGWQLLKWMSVCLFVQCVCFMCFVNFLDIGLPGFKFQVYLCFNPEA